ncbi:MULTISPECIES: lipid-A-disaccharide synthase N-terminal domain-containing protein [Parachlamydia]|jgi:lipid-A-disaccharide synthase|uniref:Lipid A biosynthesis N-terminal domain-containing protein n=1 Tax=Parachlamydia acanthamoebae (strain UV7) TaxID=765952 RepID=F8KWF8_PARAV|nr:lipid-A-disaccharide synthase N-terminal domain-containing protein [Parachlamydia acanthamoebae]CCB85356.1 putative uncharacterized protein [Parachlamydia acanthamoebae UV-7]
MSDNWREGLYILGFLPHALFTGRALLQWMISEKEKKSLVTPTFWKLSLAGNLFLLVHAFIQMQYHVCVIQAANAVVSWRNLNLMKPQTDQAAFRTVVLLFMFSICSVTLGFYGQAHFLETSNWFRIPSSPWHQGEETSFFWHCLGTIGLALFASRFWIQWWCAEKHKKSYLGPLFWWLSAVGECLSLVYFLRIFDPVHFIGPAFGLIPAIRNLMLIAQAKKPLQVKQEA